MDNKEIAGRIKAAREKRRITQKEVALYLGKQSSNAISEIERGNVNVTAEDVFKLADLFNTPIMYFYGQDYPNDYTEDILALIEQLSPEEIDQIKAFALSNSQQKTLLGQIQGDPTLLEDRKIAFKILENLNTGIYTLSDQLQNALNTRRHLEEIMGIKEKTEDDDK